MQGIFDEERRIPHGVTKTQQKICSVITTKVERMTVFACGRAKAQIIRARVESATINQRVVFEAKRKVLPYTKVGSHGVVQASQEMYVA